MPSRCHRCAIPAPCCLWLQSLASNPDTIIGTPGRVMHHRDEVHTPHREEGATLHRAYLSPCPSHLLSLLSLLIPATCIMTRVVHSCNPPLAHRTCLLPARAVPPVTVNDHLPQANTLACQHITHTSQKEHKPTAPGAPPSHVVDPSTTTTHLALTHDTVTASGNQQEVVRALADASRGPNLEV